MDSLHRLEEMFAHFPGIGPRQARRFVYYLLNKSPSFINEFTKLVEEVRKATSECDKCHRLFIGKAAPNILCSICSDKSRGQSLLMIVARDSDFETVERSGAYRGLYFILGGTVPVLDKEPEKRIRLQKLLEHVSSLNEVKEIILSLNATPDGEHTADIVKDALQSILKERSVKISLLGRGISTGAELEYVDGETIKNALQNRN
ncbi:MAG: toprim domain-containing protein [Patescibacteria group bacterium]